MLSYPGYFLFITTVFARSFMKKVRFTGKVDYKLKELKKINDRFREIHNYYFYIA